MSRQVIIYLVSGTGTAWTDSSVGAAALETMGFRRCSRDEYLAKGRRIAQEDAQAVREAGDDGQQLR